MLIRRHKSGASNNKDAALNREEEKEWEDERANLEMEIETLRAKVNDLERMEMLYIKDEDRLHALYEAGIIDEDGRIKNHTECNDMN